MTGGSEEAWSWVCYLEVRYESFIAIMAGIFWIVFQMGTDALAQKPELVVQTGHTGLFTSMAFSPDEKWLASGSWDETVKLWDVQTGQEIHTFTGHTWYVLSVAFSPDYWVPFVYYGK